MPRIRLSTGIILAAACSCGCSRGPSRVRPPEIDPKNAAAEAIDLYDSNNDHSLSAAELTKCPGVLSEFKAYDNDGNGEVSLDEIATRITDLRKHGVGLARLNCSVTINGRGLDNATIRFQPEPYLGAEIQSAEGITNEARHGSNGNRRRQIACRSAGP